jgi:hypothetical protein
MNKYSLFDLAREMIIDFFQGPPPGYHYESYCMGCIVIQPDKVPVQELTPMEKYSRCLSNQQQFKIIGRGMVEEKQVGPDVDCEALLESLKPNNEQE